MLEELLLSLLLTLIVVFVGLTTAAYSVYAERKVSAWIQQRVGPNRVGPLGLLQPLADALKLILKEDITPAKSNKFMHFLAPVLSTTLAIAALGIIPFAPGTIIFDSNIGILYLLAINGISVYGVVLAGWSSNSKYALIGGLRSSAQMLSYELSLGICVVSVVLLTNAFLATPNNGEYLRMLNIVEAQRDVWFMFINPLGFLIFVTTAFAEANRAPFDLIEAEQELVGGFHTEYSSMKFGAFFVGEYTHVLIGSAIITTLFMGGYLGPFENALGVSEWNDIAQFIWGLGWFTIKTVAWIFIFIWVRWTLPRFKYNQLMDLGWKKLLPLSIANLIVMAIIAYFVGTSG